MNKFLRASSLILLILPLRTNAQVIPDATTGTQVLPDINIHGILSDQINGGRIRDSNLFHSFSDFNINAGRGVYFYNPVEVTNILTRVTGINSSNINGRLGVLGNANLFFLNPNGIVFGQNASLDLNGSFVATTANGIKLANGDTFMANLNAALPSQVINVNPSALLFNQIATQAIINRSTESNQGLSVAKGRHLILAGGDVNLEGGRLTALSGKVKLLAIAGTGNVGLSVNDNDIRVNVPNDISGANILLSNRALINVSDTLGGSVSINAKNLNLSHQSSIQAGVFGIGTTNVKSGDININTSGGVNLDDSRIANEVGRGAVGNAGNINIKTNTLNAINGGRLFVSSRGQGNAGSVNLEASNAVTFDGIGNDSNYAGIFSDLGRDAVGNAGNININTGALTVSNEALIVASINRARGNAGDININATGAVSLQGNDTGWTAIASEVSHSIGNGGNINLSAASLSLVNSEIIVGLYGESRGNAGNINIQTTGAISIIANPVSDIGGIFSDVYNPRTTTKVIGNGGDINVTGQSLFLGNSATLYARTRGEVNAGNINLNIASITKVYPVNLPLIKTQSTIIKPAWKIGDKIQEANNLVRSNDGKLLLIAPINNTTSIPKASTC